MRFYLNIRDSQGFILDEEGGDYANIAAARAEAHASARDLAVNDIRSGHAIRARRIEIADARGDVLDTIAVLEIVH